MKRPELYCEEDIKKWGVELYLRDRFGEGLVYETLDLTDLHALKDAYLQTARKTDEKIDEIIAKYGDGVRPSYVSSDIGAEHIEHNLCVKQADKVIREICRRTHSPQACTAAPLRNPSSKKGETDA